MKIYCPKCHTCYSIEIGLIPADGKKLRCAACGEVWLCTHKDMVAIKASSKDGVPQNVIANEEGQILAAPPLEESKENTENVSDNEMSQIFSRLKDESSTVDKELQSQPTRKKFFQKLKKLLGWNSRLTIGLEVFLLLLILGLSIFAKRYDIVRKFPQAEQFFALIGVPSRIIGEGLEFQNIVRSYDNKEKPDLLTIKGFVYNSTDSELSVPTALINLYNTDAHLLKQAKRDLEIENISSQTKAAFSLKINIPTEAKYILLTFTK